MIEMRYVDSGLWILAFELLVRVLLGTLNALNRGLRLSSCIIIL